MPDPMRPRLVEVDVAVASSQLDHYGAVTSAFESYHAELTASSAPLVTKAQRRICSRRPSPADQEVEAGRTPEHIRGGCIGWLRIRVISRGRRRMTAFDWMNRYGRTEQGDDVESPESGVLARERTSAIDAVLATLPVDARTALLLSADGFSGEEIAATIGRSHAATRTLISRARVRVRLELEQSGDVR
jgi:hypothetical protein